MRRRVGGGDDVGDRLAQRDIAQPIGGFGASQVHVVRLRRLEQLLAVDSGIGCAQQRQAGVGHDEHSASVSKLSVGCAVVAGAEHEAEHAVRRGELDAVGIDPESRCPTARRFRRPCRAARWRTDRSRPAVELDRRHALQGSHDRLGMRVATPVRPKFGVVVQFEFRARRNLESGGLGLSASAAGRRRRASPRPRRARAFGTDTRRRCARSVGRARRMPAVP